MGMDLEMYHSRFKLPDANEYFEAIDDELTIPVIRYNYIEYRRETGEEDSRCRPKVDNMIGWIQRLCFEK